jgi:hypothetical protein
MMPKNLPDHWAGALLSNTIELFNVAVPVSIQKRSSWEAMNLALRELWFEFPY